MHLKSTELFCIYKYILNLNGGQDNQSLPRKKPY